jgi:hypothetical protein
MNGRDTHINAGSRTIFPNFLCSNSPIPFGMMLMVPPHGFDVVPQQHFVAFPRPPFLRQHPPMSFPALWTPMTQMTQQVASCMSKKPKETPCCEEYRKSPQEMQRTGKGCRPSHSFDCPRREISRLKKEATLKKKQQG